MPSFSHRILIAQNSSYQKFRNASEHFSTGYSSGFFLEKKFKEKYVLKTGISLSEFEDKINYKSIFLYENKDSIVYFSSNYIN